LPPATLGARASITADEVSFTDIDARVKDSALRGAVRLRVASGEIGGMLDGTAQLEDVAAIAAVPPTVPLAGALDFSATLAGTVTRPQVTVKGAGSALAVAGEPIDRLAAEARVAGPEVILDRLVLESGAGRLEAKATVDLNRQTYTASAGAT